MTEPLVTRRELAWVLVWAIFVMVLTCAPYVYASSIAGERTFGGFLWGVDEGNVYATWMRQAAEGEVFFRNQYTTEPENPRFVNLFFQLGGRLSALARTRPVVVFHGLRLLSGVLLLWSFYLLVAEVTRDRMARWAALLLASLGSGLGWVVALQDGVLGLRPIDVGTTWQVQPEAVTFPSLLLNGLFVAAMALMCVVFRYALKAMRDNDTRAAVRAGLGLLVLGNVHTYNVFAVHLGLVLWLAWGVLARQVDWRQAARHYGVIFALGLPTVVWAVYAAQADPAFMAKGLTPTPAFRFVDYAVGYGLVGVLAVGGAVLALRRCRAGACTPPAVASRRGRMGDSWGPIRPGRAHGGPDRVPPPAAERQATGGSPYSAPPEWLPVCWAVANSVVLLVPVSFQRKMIEGLHLPLCILAGMAVAALAAWITRGSRARGKLKEARERVVLTLIAVTAFVLPSNALFLASCMASARSNNRELAAVLQPPIYLDAAEARAMEWLSDNATREDVIVSSSFMGSYIPTYSPAKVWIGHWAETLHFGERLRDLEAVFGAGGGEALLAELRRRGMTMAFYGPWERALAPQWRQGADEALRKVYDEGGVAIYRVPPAGPGAHVSATRGPLLPRECEG